MKSKSEVTFVILLVAASLARPAEASPIAQKTISSARAFSHSTKQGHMALVRAIQKEQAGDRLGAIDAYSELLKFYPKTGIYFACRAYLRAELDDVEGAKQDCQSALEHAAEEAAVYYKVGRTKALLGDSEGAIADYTKASSLKPKYRNIYAYRALEREQLDDYKGALEDFNLEVTNYPADAWTITERAKLYVRMRNAEAAKADFAKAIELNPSLGHRARGVARAECHNQAGAIEDYTASIKFNPTVAELYSKRGTAKFTSGDTKGAIEDFDKALKIEPNNINALARRADAKVRLKDQDGALSDFDKVIEIEPKNPIHYVGRAIARAEFDDRPGALADFDTSLKLRDNSSAYVCRADYKAKWGDDAGAIADYTEVLKFRPKEASTYRHRGEIRLRTGDLAGAQADFVMAAKYFIEDKVVSPPLVF